MIYPLVRELGEDGVPATVTCRVLRIARQPGGSPETAPRCGRSPADAQSSSQDPRDPGSRRLRYCRYADDTPARVRRTKSEAEQIKQRLAAFLLEDLKLELSPDKTLSTQARSQRAGFLGYEISVARTDRRTRRPSASDRRNRRSPNGTVVLHMPAAVVKAKSTPYLSRAKPACRNPMVNEADYNIIGRFGLSCPVRV